MKHFIGVDLGTQSMKGLLLSPEGKIVAEAISEYMPDFPRPGWAENDTEQWMTALRDVIAELKEKAGITGDEIGAMAFATQNAAIVPIDRDGNALDKCINWLDRRSELQYAQLSEKISDQDALPIIGSALSSSYGVTKTMWFKQNKPDIYEKAYKFVEPSAFITAHLTGEPIVDYGNAAMTMMYDVVNREWSKKILDAAGLDIEKMCEVKKAWEIAGTIRPKIAGLLGLSSATILAVGGGDHHVGLVGSGLDVPGKVLDIAGTAEIVATYLSEPAFDETGVLGTRISTLGTYWTLEQGCIVSGGSIRWHRDTIARCSFDEMDAAAINIAPGSEGVLFLPYLQGAVTPKDIGYARGVFFGLTMNHGLPQMTHAVYEGCTFALRDCVERMDDMGFGSEMIIGSGGGTKSRLWTQMKADMTGKPIQIVKTANSTPLGAAMLAGVAQGNFKNIEEAVARLVEKGDVFEPDISKKSMYDEAYAFYRECVSSLDESFKLYNRKK
ncbi:MAG: xylulokinase [Acetivibrionales bacterium]|jgi:xylulokinase